MLKFRRQLFVIFFFILAGLPLALQMKGETTVFTSYLANLVSKGNFHEVAPGRFYRSGEMSASNLQELVSRHGIRSVIDLRLNPNEQDEGNLSEKWLIEAQGGSYLQVRLSSAKVPSLNSAEDLIRVISTAQEPILVHCSSGTHRTGFAGFLWVLLRGSGSLEDALDQLSLQYGFVGWERKLKAWFQGAPTLDSLAWRYKDYVLDARNNGSFTPEAFPIWLRNSIYPDVEDK